MAETTKGGEPTRIYIGGASQPLKLYANVVGEANITQKIPIASHRDQFDFTISVHPEASGFLKL
jgi:hypothetical protein